MEDIKLCIELQKYAAIISYGVTWCSSVNLNGAVSVYSNKDSGT